MTVHGARATRPAARGGVRAALAALGLLAIAAPAVATPEAVVMITPVTVVDASGTRPGMSVLIRGGRIEAVARAGTLSPAKGALVLDGSRRFLIPGLWDMHVHLATRPETDIATALMLRQYLAYGIVGVRDMGGDPDRVFKAREDVARGRALGPAILAPGPFVDGPQEATPMVLPVASEAEARAAVRAVRERGADFVKVQAKLSREAYLAVAEESLRTGVSFAGHVPEAVSATEAVASGQRSIEHVSPALPGDAGLLLACSTVEAELRQEVTALGQMEAAADTRPEDYRARRRKLQGRLLETYSPDRCAALFADMARRGVHAVPTLAWSQAFLPSGDEHRTVPLEMLPAALATRWREGRERYLSRASAEDLAFNRRMAESSISLVGEMHRAGVPLMAGTDALDAFVLPGFSLHQELELLVRAGLTPLDALRAATTTPAAFLGRAGSQGRIAAGMAADLVLLEADPTIDIRNTRQIQAVIRDGRVLARADLDAVLAEARTAGTPPAPR